MSESSRQLTILKFRTFLSSAAETGTQLTEGAGPHTVWFVSLYAQVDML